MQARHGDHLVVEGTRVGSPRREGEVLETHGADGGPPFLVRWSDGVQCLVYPGNDAHIEPATPANG